VNSNSIAAQLRPVLLLVAVVSSLTACGRKPARPDHLVIVLLDTLRADRMSVYGFEKETTPFLERLSEESVLFENFKAVAPWTLPTHATLFTGLRPAQHGAQWGRIELPGEYLTLAEVLENNGFCTAGLSANPLVRRNNGLVQGFEEYEIVTGPWPQRTEKILASFEGSLDDLLTRECRFLFFLNLMDTHIPYNSGKNAALFGAEGPGPVKNAAVKWAISSGTRDFSDEEKAGHSASYEAAVRTVDDAARWGFIPRWATRSARGRSSWPSRSSFGFLRACTGGAESRTCGARLPFLPRFSTGSRSPDQSRSARFRICWRSAIRIP
jgi:hypothetical protein